MDIPDRFNVKQAFIDQYGELPERLALALDLLVAERLHYKQLSERRQTDRRKP